MDTPSTPTAATRFVLLCHARTGSNLMMAALEKHPEIRMLGEVFHGDEVERRKIAASSFAKSTAYRNGEDGAAYLEREVFLSSPKKPIRACGCKLFFDDARFDLNVRTAWESVVSNRDIRIILLSRSNLLNCLVSREVAMRTHQWSRPLNAVKLRKPEVRPFALEPDRCHWYFDRILSWRAWAADAFRDHPLLRLEYEADLDGRFPQAMSRTFDFLGVSPTTAKPRIEKQRTKSPAEQLSNFEALRSHFKYTLYQRFFEEEPA